jgi:hypothetical protein
MLLVPDVRQSNARNQFAVLSVPHLRPNRRHPFIHRQTPPRHIPVIIIIIPLHLRSGARPPQPQSPSNDSIPESGGGVIIWCTCEFKLPIAHVTWHASCGGHRQQHRHRHRALTGVMRNPKPRNNFLSHISGGQVFHMAQSAWPRAGSPPHRLTSRLR